MIRVRNKYTGGIVSVPTIFVALCWVAVWLLWGSIETPSSAGKGVSAKCSLTYSGSGTDGDVTGRGRYQSGGFGPGLAAVSVFDESSGEILAARSAEVISRTMPYEKIGAHRVKDILPFDKPLSVTAAEAVKGYRHDADDGIIFEGMKFPPAVIRIEVPDTLQKAGFKVPQSAGDSVKKIDRPWQTSLFVEFDESGRPSDILILAGSSDREIDRDVVKMIYNAEIAAGVRNCRGQVVVSSNGTDEQGTAGGAGATLL